MGNSSAWYTMQQLLYQFPLLIASLVGLILSFVFWKRCTMSSILALIGTAVLIVSAVVVTMLQSYLFFAGREYAWSTARYGQLMGLVAVLGAIARGLGVGALVAAVFTGRGQTKSG